MTNRLASCSCGQLTVATRGEPTRVSICHCLACQRRSGSAFAVQARFPEDAVTVGGRPFGGVHLAFNVPDNRFPAAMAWLRERVALQCSQDGQDYFALESSWQSQSVYFGGPDGLILELIGRRRLPGSPQEGGFHGRELTALSEVGLPSRDVPAAQAEAQRHFGLRPLSAPSAVFAPMGDDEGLLILVDARRRWFPEQKDLPNAQGLQVRVDRVQGAGPLRDDAQGWCVATA